MLCLEITEIQMVRKASSLTRSSKSLLKLTPRPTYFLFSLTGLCDWQDGMYLYIRIQEISIWKMTTGNACQVSFLLCISDKSASIKVENYSYMPECILILCGYIREMKGWQSFPSLRGPFKDWVKLQFLLSEKYKAFFPISPDIPWVGNKVWWWFSWQWLVSLASYQLSEGHNEKQLVKQQGLIQGNSTVKDSAQGGRLRCTVCGSSDSGALQEMSAWNVTVQNAAEPKLRRLLLTSLRVTATKLCGQNLSAV